MIEPVLSNDAFLADVRRTTSYSGGFRLWWLGQSGFLVQWQGKHLLIDPYLSDSLTKKYAYTDKPHVRMTARVVAPDRLDFIDVVTSSHNHTDHLDAETLLPLMAANPGLRMIIPEANRQFVADRLQLRDPAWPIGLDDGQSAEAQGFRLHAVPSAHEEVERDAAGRCKFLGYVIRIGPWTLYHSGDCVLYNGLAELLRQWPIDVALLPINGRSPERRVPGNFRGKEAANLAEEMGARLVVPCHYEMFEFNTVTPEEFVREARRIGQPCRLLQCGEALNEADVPARSAC